MARSTVDSWLKGPSDLTEADVEDVPTVGESVRVRGLPASYSNRASSQALELLTDSKGRQSATVNTERLEIIQFAQGVVDPPFTEEQAEVISQKYGPAFKKVVAEVDRLSGVDKEALEKADATFQSGGAEPEDSGDAEAGSGAS